MLDDAARRRANRLTGVTLCKAGLAVFVSSGKVPLIPRYNQLDTTITTEQREQAIEEYEAKHGKPPIHVGSTKDAAVFRKMHDAFPDAVTSVACGPSKLVVLDADTKDGGPEKMDGLHEELGGVPAGVQVIRSQSGGKHFIYADPEGKFTNRAGALKKDYGTDVRGTGGQFVAPGSVREDGKTYGTKDDQIAFLRAYVHKQIPTLPERIVELIGETPEAADKPLSESETAHIVAHLEAVDWPEYDEVFDATLGTYDLDALRASNEEFAKLYDDPSSDCSDNRFFIARHLMREYPDMPAEHLAVFFENWEGSGELTADGKGSGNYNLRDIAREWMKNQGLQKLSPPSKGDALDAIADDEAEDYVETTAPAQPGATLSRLRSLAVFTDPDYILEGVFTRRMVGAISGQSNVGKSFSGIDLGQRIQEGMPWYGLNTKQCGVLYCYGEGHSGINNRALAWCRKYKPKTEGIFVRNGVPNLALNLAKGTKAIEKSISEANALLASTGEPSIGVVFVDTFAKATAGLDENLVKDMQPILNALRSVAEKTDVCIILIHHTGKDSAAGLRGSSAILGDVDFVFEIVDAQTARARNKNKPLSHADNLCILMPKSRDGRKNSRFEFRLEEVELGKNAWGNPVTSVVVTSTADPSKGDALDAIAEDDDVPTTQDNLTADQNKKAEEDRLALCERIVAAMRSIGQLVGDTLYATVPAVVEEVPALKKLFAESGDNFARDLRKKLFRGDASGRVASGGWLSYRPARGQKSSLFMFGMKAPT